MLVCDQAKTRVKTLTLAASPRQTDSILVYPPPPARHTFVITQEGEVTPNKSQTKMKNRSISMTCTTGRADTAVTYDTNNPSSGRNTTNQHTWFKGRSAQSWVKAKTNSSVNFLQLLGLWKPLITNATSSADLLEKKNLTTWIFQYKADGAQRIFAEKRPVLYEVTAHLTISLVYIKPAYVSMHIRVCLCVCVCV